MLVKRWSNAKFVLFFLMPTPKDGKLFRPAPPSAVDLRPSVTAELISKRRLPDMSSHWVTTHDRMRFCKFHERNPNQHVPCLSCKYLYNLNSLNISNVIQFDLSKFEASFYSKGFFEVTIIISC